MFALVFGYLFNIVSKSFEWFGRVIESMGATDWVIVSIIFAIGIRFVLAPLTGGRFSSDVARGVGSARRNAKFEERKEQIAANRRKG